MYSHGTTHVASRPSRDCAPTLGYHGIRTRRRSLPTRAQQAFLNLATDVNCRRSDWPRPQTASRTYWPGGRSGFGGKIRFWRFFSRFTAARPVTCKRTRVTRPPTARRTSALTCNNCYYYQYYYCNNACTF